MEDEGSGKRKRKQKKRELVERCDVKRLKREEGKLIAKDDSGERRERKKMQVK